MKKGILTLHRRQEDRYDQSPIKVRIASFSIV